MFRNIASKLWNDDQDEELRNIWVSQKISMEKVASLLGRSPSAIRSRLCVLGLHFRVRHREWKKYGALKPASSYTIKRAANDQQRIIDQDKQFQKAMKVAIRQGLESAPIGVFVDTRPPKTPPIRIRPHSYFSGTGSSAAQCAALGEGAYWE